VRFNHRALQLQFGCWSVLPSAFPRQSVQTRTLNESKFLVGLRKSLSHSISSPLGTAVRRKTEIFPRGVGRMGLDQLPQLATYAAVEFQIGPQFDPHGNIPMYRANGDAVI
jgi:hypothetical protein